MELITQLLVTVIISVATYIVGGGIVGALQRRGWDPVGAIARFLSPDPEQLEVSDG